MEQHTILRKQLDTLWTQILGIHPANRRDLTRMWRNSDEVWIEMDKELINCRRLKHLTIKYQELSSKLEELLNSLEQYVVFAKLLN